MSRLICLLIAFAALTTPGLAAPGAEPSQDNTAFKAAMIYNIGRFTRWSPERLGSSGDLALCVEDGEPIAPALAALQGKPIGDGQLHIRRQAWPFSGACQIAYVGARRASDEALVALAARGALTVGETPEFCRQGAVGLVSVGRQTRFEINNGQARRAGAILSSQVLRLAMRVR